MMNISDEYIAGIFDGEGCIAINKSKKEIGTYNLTVVLGMRCPTIPNILKEIYGGGLARRPNGVTVWMIRCNKAVVFLEKIVPYLIVKKKQALLGIEYQKQKLSCKHLAKDQIQRELSRRELFYWRMRELNSEWSSFSKRAVDSYKLLKNNVLIQNEVQT